MATATLYLPLFICHKFHAYLQIYINEQVICRNLRVCLICVLKLLPTQPQPQPHFDTNHIIIHCIFIIIAKGEAAIALFSSELKQPTSKLHYQFLSDRILFIFYSICKCYTFLSFFLERES